MADKNQTENAKTGASASDAGAKELQQAFDKASKQGYFGTTPDETPNENYTVKGVVAGKPTPENDAGRKEVSDGK